MLYSVFVNKPGFMALTLCAGISFLRDTQPFSVALCFFFKVKDLLGLPIPTYCWI